MKRLLPLHLYFFACTCICFSTFKATAQGYIKSARLYAGSATNRSLIADNSGNSYMLITTANNAFPVTIAYPALGTGTKAVLAKYDADGNVTWARYLPHSSTGAGATDFVRMELDNGVLYILGSSTAADVPVSNGSTFKGGTADVVFTRVDAASGSLLNTAYLGGSGNDNNATGLVVQNGSVYVAYTTTSTDIPVTTGPAYAAGNDHVVTKMDVQANIIYCTYTGGTGSLDELSLQVTNGNAYLGTVVSSTNNFTTTNGSTVQGSSDFGLVGLDASGNTTFRLVYGGTGDESAVVLDVNSSDVFLSGYTTSGNYAVTDGSSFTGTDRRHVVTKFSNTGAVLFSSNQAGVTVTADVPRMQVKNGSVYLMGSNHIGVPAVHVTDGSTGGNYLIKLHAVNGQTQYAVRFGGIRFAANGYGCDLTVGDDGKAYAVTQALNATQTNTDGSLKLSNGGVHINAFTPEGKQFFASSKVTGALPGSNLTPRLAISPGKLFVAVAVPSAAVIHIPVTEPIAGTISGSGSTPAFWAMFNMCPSLPADNTITPLTQNVCAGGFTQSITGNKVAYASTDMPVPTRNGVNYPQMEITGRYQWQSAGTATGPWTDIPGPGTQKDYTPPSLAESRYYRRLVLPPLGCGDDPVSTSGVAAVLVSSDVAPVITGDIFNTCVGTPVNISVNVSGGATPYTFAWDNGISSTTNTANVTPTGNSVYTVTVTDNIGCQQAGQVIVNAYAADAGPAAVSSCAGKPVRIGTAPPAGLTGVTYSWSPIDGLDDPTAAQPLASPTITTVYTLTMTLPVSGGGNCVTTDDVTVNVVAAPVTPNFAGDDQAVCKGGTLSLGTAAEAGFTYTWAPGNYLSTVTASSTAFNAGSEMPVPNPLTYQLTATSNGCTFVDDVTVAVLEVDAGKDFCGPRQVGTGDKLSGITGKVYAWSVVSGPGTITGATDAATTTVSASTGGSTIYRLTVSYLGVSCSDDVEVGECGSTGCAGIDIEVLAAQGCPGNQFGQVQLKAIPALPGSDWTYTWSSLPAGGLSATTGTLVSLTDNVERDVTVTVTSKINPAISCSKTIHVNDPSWSLPVFTAQDLTACPGATVSLGAAPVAGYNYEWTNVDAGQENNSNPTATVNTTTGYIVHVTDNGSGCIRIDTATVTIKPVAVDPGGDWITCSNAVLELGSPALPGYTYSWVPAVAAYQDGTDNLSAQPKVLVTTSQDFTLTATDTETGCSKDSLIHIVVDNNPSLPAMDNKTICLGSETTIGNPEQPGVTYSWSPATGLSSTTVAQPLANPASTQTYTLTVTYYDAGGLPICTKTGDVTVTVSAPEITGIADATVCPSDGLHDLGAGVTVNGTSPFTYSWSPAALVTSPTTLSTTVKANPVTPTSYTLVVTDANGCRATATKTITPTIPAPIAGSNSMVCVGSSITLGDASNTGVINWSVTPAIAGTLNTATSAQPVFTPATGDANKNFTFTITQDIGGCTSTAQVSIVVRQLTLAAINPQTICSNASTTIGTTAQPNISYVWTPSTGLDNPNASTTTVSNVTGSRVYTLTATDLNGCSASQQAIIGVNASPAPSVEIPDVTAPVGTTPPAFQPAVNPAAGSYTYSWTPAAQVDDPYIANARPNGGNLGTTTYSLAVTDANGCTSTAQAQLTVTQWNIPLPITLVSFTATTNNCNVVLRWKTADAKNFARFIVERSHDGVTFNPIATINYSYVRNSYSYTDGGAGDGTWLYRLKLVDIDGSATYSTIVTARTKCSNNQLLVYPNPFNSYLNIRSSQAVKQVKLMSIAGQILFKKTYNQSQPGLLQVSVDGFLKRGIYILEVVDVAGEVQYFKLLKD